MKNSILRKCTALFFAAVMLLMLLPAAVQAETTYPVLKITDDNVKLWWEDSDLGYKRIMYKGEEILYMSSDGGSFEVVDKAGNRGSVNKKYVVSSGMEMTENEFYKCTAYLVTDSSTSYSEKPNTENIDGFFSQGETVLLAYKYSNSVYCVMSKNRKNKLLYVESSSLSKTKYSFTYEELRNGRTASERRRTEAPRTPEPTEKSRPKPTQTPKRTDWNHSGNKGKNIYENNTVLTVKENSFLYSDASYESKTKRHIWKGEEMLCIGSEGPYYRVMDRAGVKGYVHREDIKSTDRQEKESNFLQCRIYIVSNNCSYYSKPDYESSGSCSFGENVVMLCLYSDDFWYVRLSDGRYAFIRSVNLYDSGEKFTYEELHNGRTVGGGDSNEYVVARAGKKYIYLYDQPSSTQGKNLGSYKNGTHCVKLGTAKGGEWFKVRFGNKVGYVRAEYLVPASKY